jgi:hypothetical protein
MFGYGRAFEARVRSAGARSFLTAIVLLLTLGRPVSAQTGERPRNLEWWHPLAAGAGVATLMLVDDPCASSCRTTAAGAWTTSVT